VATEYGFPTLLLDLVEAAYRAHPHDRVLLPDRGALERHLDARGRWMLAIWCPTGADVDRLVEAVQQRVLARIDALTADYLGPSR